MRTQCIFWLGNHTTGANWDTVEQLLFRAAEDEGANICNPGFTPLTSWEVRGEASEGGHHGRRETPRFLVDKPLDVRMYTP